MQWKTLFFKSLVLEIILCSNISPFPSPCWHRCTQFTSLIKYPLEKSLHKNNRKKKKKFSMTIKVTILSKQVQKLPWMSLEGESPVTVNIIHWRFIQDQAKATNQDRNLTAKRVKCTGSWPWTGECAPSLYCKLAGCDTITNHIGTTFDPAQFGPIDRSRSCGVMFFLHYHRVRHSVLIIKFNPRKTELRIKPLV